jgi:hypothetical protein
MPKKSPSSPHTLSKQQRIQGILDKIRRLYKLGEESNALSWSERSEFDRKQADIDPLQMRRARQFGREYSSARLEEYLALRKPDGRPLQFNYLPHFLRIHSKAERRELEKLTAKRGWSVPELDAEISWRQGRATKRSPKRHKRPVDPQQGLVQLTTRSNLWVSWWEALEPMLAEIKITDDNSLLVEDAAGKFEELARVARKAAQVLRGLITAKAGKRSRAISRQR